MIGSRTNKKKVGLGVGALAMINVAAIVSVRNLPVMNHLSVDGHCELLFRDVHVGKDALLGEIGDEGVDLRLPLAAPLRALKDTSPALRQ